VDRGSATTTQREREKKERDPDEQKTSEKNERTRKNCMTKVALRRSFDAMPYSLRQGLRGTGGYKTQRERSRGAASRETTSHLKKPDSGREILRHPEKYNGVGEVGTCICNEASMDLFLGKGKKPVAYPKGKGRAAIQTERRKSPGHSIPRKGGREKIKKRER